MDHVAAVLDFANFIHVLDGRKLPRPHADAGRHDITLVHRWVTGTTPGLQAKTSASDLCPDPGSTAEPVRS